MNDHRYVIQSDARLGTLFSGANNAVGLTVHPQDHNMLGAWSADGLLVVVNLMLDTLVPGSILLADRAYDADKLREAIANKGAFANIPPMPQRVRRSAFSPFLYRYRNLIERFFNNLKHFRAIATRYDKRDDNYLASVQLASIRIWLRHNESVT